MLGYMKFLQFDHNYAWYFSKADVEAQFNLMLALTFLFKGAKSRCLEYTTFSIVQILKLSNSNSCIEI